MKAKTSIQHFRYEKELEMPVSRFLRNREFRLQELEVPFYEYRMDMYGYSESADTTVAVELKLSKWTRAIEQALLYQLCSDLVYIAMPKRQAETVDVAMLKLHGLGLISVGSARCTEIVPAVPSRIVRRHYREACLAILEGGEKNVVKHPGGSDSARESC
jgi:hypothetical protein